MRAVSLIPAIVALFLSSAASAQVWEEYVNRDEFFQVNMPGEPTVTEAPYRTVKGTNLTAKVFSGLRACGLDHGRHISGDGGGLQQRAGRTRRCHRTGAAGDACQGHGQI